MATEIEQLMARINSEGDDHITFVNEGIELIADCCKLDELKEYIQEMIEDRDDWKAMATAHLATIGLLQLVNNRYEQHKIDKSSKGN